MSERCMCVILTDTYSESAKELKTVRRNDFLP
jgi:hypothetical protein